MNASDAEALGVNAGDVVASALVVVESTEYGNTSTLEVQNLEPVPTDTIISIKETQYTIYIKPYSGERIVTPRISIERDTTVNKLNIEQVRRAEKEKNNINYNNAK